MANYQPPVQDHGVSVVGQQFCAPYPIELTVKQKVLSLTGADFTVTDAANNLVLKVAGKVMSLHDRRVLEDAAGNPLLTMKQKMISMHRRWDVYRGQSDSDRDFVFMARKSSVLQLRTALNVFMAGNKGEKEPDFQVKGSFLERNCTIYRGAQVIAEMKRKYTVANVLMERDTFVVAVQPGIDYAFAVSLIVILNEINEDRRDED